MPAESADDLVTARGAGVVVVVTRPIVMAAASVQAGGRVARRVDVSKDPESIERVADHRGVAVGLGDLLGAACGGVVVIALVRVDVAARMIERGDGVGVDDVLNGRGRIIGRT